MQGFCLNNRQWVVLMDAKNKYPKSCVSKGKDCSTCRYYEMRSTTAYLERTLDKICFIDKDETSVKE